MQPELFDNADDECNDEDYVDRDLMNQIPENVVDDNGLVLYDSDELEWIDEEIVEVVDDEHDDCQASSPMDVDNPCCTIEAMDVLPPDVMSRLAQIS